MAVVFYNRRHKALGIERPVGVVVPMKIARRITMLAKERRDRQSSIVNSK